MHVLKLTRIRNSVGLVLPAEMLATLELEAGDVVFLTETAEGWMLTVEDPMVKEQIDAGRTFIRDYRATLNALAI